MCILQPSSAFRATSAVVANPTSWPDSQRYVELGLRTSNSSWRQCWASEHHGALCLIIQCLRKSQQGSSGYYGCRFCGEGVVRSIGRHTLGNCVFNKVSNQTTAKWISEPRDSLCFCLKEPLLIKLALGLQSGLFILNNFLYHVGSSYRLFAGCVLWPHESHTWSTLVLYPIAVTPSKAGGWLLQFFLAFCFRDGCWGLGHCSISWTCSGLHHTAMVR